MTKVKKVKAWIGFWPKKMHAKPTILWEKPNNLGEKYGFVTAPCTITYSLPSNKKK